MEAPQPTRSMPPAEPTPPSTSVSGTQKDLLHQQDRSTTPKPIRPTLQTSQSLPASPLQKVRTPMQARSPAAGAAAALPPSPPATRAASSGRTRLEYDEEEVRNSSGKHVTIPGTRAPGAVDYLLPNGGLPTPISIGFSLANDLYKVQGGSQASSEDDESEDHHLERHIFQPLHMSLEAFAQILRGGGSVAVGTGYRSVARRLLERVDGVFSRDIGVPWSEVLEALRGAKKLPVLPTCPIDGLLRGTAPEEENASTLLASKAAAAPAPVPENVEVRGPEAQHLACAPRVKAKTKVEEWLEITEAEIFGVRQETADGAAVPPAPRTIASQTASNILNGRDRLPAKEEQQLVNKVIMNMLEEVELKGLYEEYYQDTELLDRTFLSLTRLYPNVEAATITPPIMALYLVLHPDLHPLLEGVSRMNDGELELINLGKFDGFLDSKVLSPDEEAELKALETLDKNIYRTMELLEDEIENLHLQAEAVRRGLRARKDAIRRHKSIPSPTSAVPTQQTATNTPRSPSPANFVPKIPMLPPASIIEQDFDNLSTVTPSCCAIAPSDSASNAPHRRRKHHHHHHDKHRKGSSTTSRRRDGSTHRKKKMEAVEEEKEPKSFAGKVAKLLIGEKEEKASGSGVSRKDSHRSDKDRSRDKEREREREKEKERERRERERAREKEKERARERMEREREKERERERERDRERERVEKERKEREAALAAAAAAARVASPAPTQSTQAANIPLPSVTSLNYAAPSPSATPVPTHSIASSAAPASELRSELQDAPVLHSTEEAELQPLPESVLSSQLQGDKSIELTLEAMESADAHYD